MAIFRHKTSTRPAGRLRGIFRRMRRLFWRALLVMVLIIGLFGVINPPTTWTIMQESTHPRHWTKFQDIAPVMVRSVVAAEDANFCLHWGFDMQEIRKVIAAGSRRGASTITQQAVKNVFLWQGRRWLRKLPEAMLTPMVEAIWTKRRILEIYLNVIEFGPGVFGIHAAADYHFKTTPDRLNADQAARLAAILPAPKTRNPHAAQLTKRARAIADGAATIARDGRDACFRLPASR